MSTGQLSPTPLLPMLETILSQILSNYSSHSTTKLDQITLSTKWKLSDEKSFAAVAVRMPAGVVLGTSDGLLLDHALAFSSGPNGRTVSVFRFKVETPDEKETKNKARLHHG